MDEKNAHWGSNCCIEWTIKVMIQKDSALRGHHLQGRKSLSLLFLSHSHLQILLHQESELSLEFTHFSARKANYFWIHIFPKATHLIEPILLGNVCLIPSPLCAWIQWQPNSNNVVHGWKAFLRVVDKPAQVVVLKEFYKGSPIWVLYVQFVAFLS